MSSKTILSSVSNNTSSAWFYASKEFLNLLFSTLAFFLDTTQHVSRTTLKFGRPRCLGVLSTKRCVYGLQTRSFPKTRVRGTGKFNTLQELQSDSGPSSESTSSCAGGPTTSRTAGRFNPANVRGNGPGAPGVSGPAVSIWPEATSAGTGLARPTANPRREVMTKDVAPFRESAI